MSVYIVTSTVYGQITPYHETALATTMRAPYHQKRSGYCLIKTEALFLDFVRLGVGVVGSQLHLIHAEKCGRVESLYDYDGCEDNDHKMSSLVGRCCDDETRPPNDCDDDDDAAKHYV